MSYLTERLRAYRGAAHETTECYNGTRDEAADEIARLTDQLAEAREALKRLRLDDKGGTDALTVVQRGLRRVQELRDAYPSEDAYLHGTISVLGSECLNDDIEGLEWLAEVLARLAAPHTPEARIAEDKP